jgi:hypothetical protein
MKMVNIPLCCKASDARIQTGGSHGIEETAIASKMKRIANFRCHLPLLAAAIHTKQIATVVKRSAIAIAPS